MWRLAAEAAEAVNHGELIQHSSCDKRHSGVGSRYESQTMLSSVLKCLRSRGNFSSVIPVIKSFPNRTFSGKVSFSFIESKTGNKVVVTGDIGKTVLDVAVAHDIDIEGACGGELACSTCHVIVTKELFDLLPKKKEEEDDMLDLAWGLKET